MWHNLKTHFHCRTIVVLISLVMMVLLVGCQADSGKVYIDVYAASSFIDVFNDIRDQFELEHPEIGVRVNYAGSKTLRSQLENGAEADIFISANIKHYEALYQQGIITEGHHFIQNEMVLITPVDGPVIIESLEDLTKDLKLVLAEENVPAGDYARQVLKNLNKKYGIDYFDRVHQNLVSSESNVRQVLMKIELGEVDAAIVYRTDAQSSEAPIQVLEIPSEYNVVGTYCVGITEESDSGIRLLFDYILSEEAQNISLKYGFLPAQID